MMTLLLAWERLDKEKKKEEYMHSDFNGTLSSDDDVLQAIGWDLILAFFPL